jgi:hypothetical protein
MLLMAAALISISASKATAPLAQPKSCPRTTRYYAWDRDKFITPRKLAQLPPANIYATVYRRVDGCEVPLVVKYGVGGR